MEELREQYRRYLEVHHPGSPRNHRKKRLVSVVLITFGPILFILALWNGWNIGVLSPTFLIYGILELFGAAKAQKEYQRATRLTVESDLVNVAILQANKILFRKRRDSFLAVMLFFLFPG